MHVAAAAPLALTPEEITADVVERERAVFTEQARESGKPDNIIEKMVEGRIRKFYEESVLLSQAFVINPDLTVAKAAEEAGKEAAVIQDRRLRAHAAGRGHREGRGRFRCRSGQGRRRRLKRAGSGWLRLHQLTVINLIVSKALGQLYRFRRNHVALARIGNLNDNRRSLCRQAPFLLRKLQHGDRTSFFQNSAQGVRRGADGRQGIRDRS